MQKTIHSSNNWSFLTFTLVCNNGLIDDEWHIEPWDRFLCNKFTGVTVIINGYNFNNEQGIHTVRLLSSDSNSDSMTEYTKQVNAWLNGIEELPECGPKNIDLGRSQKYNHVNDLFTSFR